MRREDLEPGVGRRDEHDEQPVAATLLRERHCGLVAVMAVGDQELAIGEERLDPRSPSTRQSRVPRRRVGVAAPASDRRVAVVEQEDRLELRTGGAKQREAALDRPAMRALVREHGARRVRLGAEGGDQAGPATRRPSGPT